MPKIGVAEAALPDSAVRNLLPGVVPTLFGIWAVEPTDLSKTTDEDIDTATGLGSTASDNSEIFGLIFDLGSVKVIESIFVKFALTTTIEGLCMAGYVGLSENGVNWLAAGLESNDSLSEIIFSQFRETESGSMYTVARYIRVYFTSGDTGNEGTVRVFEVMAFGPGY